MSPIYRWLATLGYCWQWRANVVKLLRSSTLAQEIGRSWQWPGCHCIARELRSLSTTGGLCHTMIDLGFWHNVYEKHSISEKAAKVQWHLSKSYSAKIITIFNIQNHWVYGLRPSYGILIKHKTKPFGNWICFLLQVRGRRLLLCLVPYKELTSITDRFCCVFQLLKILEDGWSPQTQWFLVLYTIIRTVWYGF
jgi:hypothetical protein